MGDRTAMVSRTPAAPASPEAAVPRDQRDRVVQAEAIGQAAARDEVGAITDRAHQAFGAPAPLFGVQERREGPGQPAPAIVATIFLIGGEVMFFAGLIFAFWVLRLGAPLWPPPFQPRLPVALTGVNTLVLLASSVAMLTAGRALARGDRPALVGRLGLAAGLGATFLVVQGYEWARLLGFGLRASTGVYGATFYTLIGAHGMHVIAALVWLGVAWALAARGRFAGERVAGLRACALYWHFVVALWPVLYVSVYLS